MKNFRCSIWGEIELSDLAISIVDTFPFQRLHYIKQTGFAYKVFPNANSSRFEHSIGTYHVTKTIINELCHKCPQSNFDNRKKELICIQALIHDLGHGPFSHLFDHLLEKLNITAIAKTHEERSTHIFSYIVQKYNIDISDDEVLWINNRILSPPNHMWYDTLVYNPYSSFDTDKLDYIIRDSIRFGLNNVINFNRILKNMLIIDNKLCFCDRIQDEIDTLFNIREKMHTCIYRHPTIEKCQNFFLSNFNESSLVIKNYEDFFLLHDLSLLSLLPLKIWKQIEEREFKNYTYSTHKYSDKQKEKAFKNILFYNRKNTNLYFNLDF